MLTLAALCLISATALMNAPGSGKPETGKLSTARWV